MEFMTAGESHGPQLTGVITGIPAGLAIDVTSINDALAKRQGGYGRGARQKIEHDQVQIVGGVRHGVTLGGPIALVIVNRDHDHWQAIMDPVAKANPENTLRQVQRPRAGHADLVGGQKYGHRDLRNVLERSSARETAMKVAIGAVCEQLLAALGIHLVGYVQSVGAHDGGRIETDDVTAIKAAVNANDLRVLDANRVSAIHAAIDDARHAGDTLGGTVRVVANGLPAGIGSYTTAPAKLDGQIAAAVMSVNAIKGVAFGDGFAVADRPGSTVMDAITWDADHGYQRASNHLGGLEGGMTNGMPLVVTAAMKPIPTLYHPLPSVNIETKAVSLANVERSDTTAIVPASIVVEMAVAIALTQALCAQFDDSNFARMKAQVAAYREELRRF
ncbi:chorismate synthase [Lacticaseibacillus baoqingensis]|uniref:Chorismate synthase n=1 Tax=Lacticaseibacillus baoqingensis TaxID=2486013 RepID=A0ABW4E369_9LACO|nr:chorismate synthase [Lacticaseibacillus baoqingensis]